MRPQSYTKDYKQLRKAGSRTGDLLPGKSTPIDCLVSNGQLQKHSNKLCYMNAADYTWEYMYIKYMYTYNEN